MSTRAGMLPGNEAAARYAEWEQQVTKDAASISPELLQKMQTVMGHEAIFAMAHELRTRNLIASRKFIHITDEEIAERMGREVGL